MKSTILLACISYAILSIQAFADTSTKPTANEVAIRIINEQPRGGYNPTDSSDEELANAAAHNSNMRLNWLMANQEGISEEIRICYAIKLISHSLWILEMSDKDPDKQERLRADRLLLGSRLVQIEKKQNKTEMATPNQPSD